MNFQAILCDGTGFIRVAQEREASEPSGSINCGKLSCLAEQLQASLCDSLNGVRITLLSTYSGSQYNYRLGCRLDSGDRSWLPGRNQRIFPSVDHLQWLCGFPSQVTNGYL